MLEVEFVTQWAANTLHFKEDDTLYLRLDNTQIVWYKLSDDYTGTDAWVWIKDSSKLEEAWVSRGGIPFEDIQTFGG